MRLEILLCRRIIQNLRKVERKLYNKPCSLFAGFILLKREIGVYGMSIYVGYISYKEGSVKTDCCIVKDNKIYPEFGKNSKKDSLVGI